LRCGPALMKSVIAFVMGLVLGMAVGSGMIHFWFIY
jgi:hypothetical protein